MEKLERLMVLGKEEGFNVNLAELFYLVFAGWLLTSLIISLLDVGPSPSAIAP